LKCICPQIGVGGPLFWAPLMNFHKGSIFFLCFLLWHRGHFGPKIS
jgi:hypothetical protein